ncbi:Aa_trans domain-containing protein [Raphanus sativus]|nr:Aa_trans domain-containing protein [Raphanus sativus]
MDSSPVSVRLDIFEIYRRFCEIQSSQGLCNIYKPHEESQRANYLKEALTQLLTLVHNKFQPRISIFDELFKLMSRLDLMVDFSEFTRFYDFVFFMCRENGQKSINVGRAVTAWKLVLVGRFRLLNHWCDYIEKNQRHNITEDTWQQVLVFSRCVHENLQGYDSQGSWPVLIDEFVEHMYRKVSAMEEDNHEKQLDDGGSSSLFKTCFNALNAFSGIGILSVPYSLARGGWLSLSLLLLLAATAFYTSLLITKCMNADRSIKTYPDIGERAFGRPGRIIVSVFMHLELYLVTTGFLIMEGDNLHNLFPGFNIEMIGLRMNGKQSFMASVALVIMPTLWWDNLSVLSYVSMSGVLATVVTLGSISWVGAVDGIGFRQSRKLINWSGIPTALSLYAFCYGAHPVLPTLYNSMKSKHQFNNVLLISFILCTIGYTSMAVLGYLMYGSNTLSQITLNLPTHKTSSKVAIYTTLVNPIAKYALMITPTVNTIKDWFPSRYAKKTYLHLLISTLCIASSVVIAETLPFFGYMMSLVGALLSVTVSILLPCLCYLKISGSFKKFGFETIMLFVMVAMSVPIGVLGTYIAIRELVVSV